ncbi:MAG: PspC domain-containing protein [Bacteroidia bacterium]
MQEVYPEKKLLGVCAWLSVKFSIDVTLLRIIFVVAAILGVGAPILIYLILYLVKPAR